MPRIERQTRFRCLCRPVGAVVLIAVIVPVGPVLAQEPKSFRELREQLSRSAFEATRDYLAKHPNAEDSVEAYQYLFETALDHDLAREARPAAERFLSETPDASTADRLLARRVAMIALALEGEASAAIDMLGEELAVLRRLDPSAAIDAATALAAAVQRGGKPEAAKQVYERLKRSFFLNPSVSLVAENRLARLELLGQPLPEIGLADLEGRELSAAELAGKVVLIDFWATNCPPCLEELPQLRRLYADLHEEGFEIVAISLDEEESTVQAYLDRIPIPWRVALSAADSDATRERFHVETIPANFLIGSDGKVARVDLHGADLWAEAMRLLKER